MSWHRGAAPFGVGTVSILVCLAVTARAADVDYARDVKPILKSRCFACHGALQQRAGLRLDAGRLIQQGGDSGAAVVVGKPEESPLIERIQALDATARMPPEGEALTVGQIELLRRWISEGAQSPAGEEPEADPREHWAFRAPLRASVPSVEATGRPGNPIDSFVGAELARRGIEPGPAASKAVLLRRVFLDLIGLPPTRDQLLAFLADDSPQAYLSVIERLLSDPRHGERWGRHWMDVWRYSDWYGRRDVNDVRNSASQIYRWRDWIVRSLNDGKGYDRMILEMLAADEVCPEDYEAGVATGYLIRNYYSLNANDWMRSAVEHTGKAFLGLTFNCAHCHDHKYDPIAHDAYFQMRAFFEPIFIRQDRVPGEADPGIFQDYTYSGTRNVQRLGTARVYDRQTDAATWFYTGGDERNRVKERGSIPPGVPGFLQNTSLSLRIEPVKLPPRAWYPGLRPEIQQAMRSDVQAAISQAEEDLKNVRARSEAAAETVRAELTRAESAYEQSAEQAKRAGRPGALSGQQSLLLDASMGRAIVQNGVKSLTTLGDSMKIEFQLQIVCDAHVNFQLVKDTVQGLTAGYVGWIQGRILAYQPSSTNEVEVGRYDFAAGQTRFQVALEVQRPAERCLLTIRSLTDDQLLVDRAPVALNGWNPIGNETQAISFDARTGSVAVVDDVVFYSNAAEEQARALVQRFDFEAPVYSDGRDVFAIDGWASSPFAIAPASAVVSSAAANRDLRDLAQKLTLARRAAREPQLRREAAESRVEAVRAELQSLDARIAADRARYGKPVSDHAPALVRAASRLERESAVKKAEADALAGEVSLIDALALPADNANRSKSLEAAGKSLAAARAATDLARAALANEQLAEVYSPLSPQFPRESTGRRRGLAEWMTSRANPLTARVAVNHIWSRHFHAPLVSSMSDFGRNGARPTHPELLDWLAVELMESGWNMKHLHRQIVTSDAYQRASSAGQVSRPSDQLEPPPGSIDPENRLLWRMNSGRSEAEVVRDSLLFVAGRLDQTMGGVEIENSQALSTFRRSLYYSVYPEAGGKSALGELFDAADPLDCYRRSSSIVPQQALALTNSDLVHQSSAAIVKTWQAAHPQTALPAVDADDAQSRSFATEMFEQILSRPPTESELRACRKLLEEQQRLATDRSPPEAVTQARESLVRVLLNHNDFLTIR